MDTNCKTIGIVGARGHTGTELIRLIAAHPALELAFVSSRELDGQRVDAHVPEYRGELRYCAPAHEDLPKLGADVVILALAQRQGGGMRRQRSTRPAPIR